MSALEYGTSYGGALLCDGTWSSPRKLVQSECQSCGMITHKKDESFLEEFPPYVGADGLRSGRQFVRLRRSARKIAILYDGR